MTCSRGGCCIGGNSGCARRSNGCCGRLNRLDGGSSPARGRRRGTAPWNQAAWVKQFPNDGGVERIEIEADPRHSQIGVDIQPLGRSLLGRLGVRVPLPDVDVEITDKSTSSIPKHALEYVAQDRPELQYALKELARDVSKPAERREVALKRLF